MAFEFGRRPEVVRVLFIAGDDFETELELEDVGATYGGVSPELRFSNGLVVQADLVADNLARFQLAASAVSELSLLEDRGVELLHTEEVVAKGRFEVL